jgi:hypothetical protein
LDGTGDALSATLLGTSQTWNGANFSIAPAGASNVIAAAGQTVALPSGSYSHVELLATAVNGNQTNQTFTVHYTDGTSTTFTQSLSDWSAPQNYAGEAIAVSNSYRNTTSGSQANQTVDVYGYSLPVDNTKTISGITLPNNRNVAVLAISLVA